MSNMYDTRQSLFHVCSYLASFPAEHNCSGHGFKHGCDFKLFPMPFKSHPLAALGNQCYQLSDAVVPENVSASCLH